MEDTLEVLERRTAHAGQLGNVPNVDFHQSSEAHKNRRSVLREEQANPHSVEPLEHSKTTKHSEEEDFDEEVVESCETAGV